ncbi:hypothetical protein [Paraflavitalea speifideaquila]|uniref:hypothetical protein n=1 Tax=Paraflavitalea speifideaquila TaxID=3076558 RepID=UPI0028E61D34|nr:hypothetical protein [Paraflavitalea speifideiaquila]
MLGDLYKQKGVQDKYELIGAGIGGNKAYDLYLRMEEDVLAKDPNTVVIWVGVNDVWHKKHPVPVRMLISLKNFTMPSSKSYRLKT